MSVQLNCIKLQRSNSACKANRMESQAYSNQFVEYNMSNGRTDVVEESSGRTLSQSDRIMSLHNENHDLSSPLIDDDLLDISVSLNVSEAKLQGVVFLEDAIHYRSIHHKANTFCLKLYRWYYSAPIRCAVVMATFLILILAFVEEPSSLSWSSDPRRSNNNRYETCSSLLYLLYYFIADSILNF